MISGALWLLPWAMHQPDLTSVDEEQRNGPWDVALLVHEMHVQFSEPLNRDLRGELGQLIQFCFLRSPIEPIFPVLGQSCDVG